MNLQLSRLSEKTISLEEELDELRPDEIPVEVIHSPVDVHVDSLVETPAEAETIEIPEIEATIVGETTVELPVETVEPVIVQQPYVEPTLEEPVVETPAASPVFSFTPAASADDLRIVEGIGPKIEQVLNENGISTFRQLAETTEERLREILASAGSRYKMHDPTTWPEQSRLADLGDWEALKVWQDALKAGRVVEVEPSVGEEEEYQSSENQLVETEIGDAEQADTDVQAESSPDTNGIYAEPEIIPTEVATYEDAVAVKTDDLKIIEGIGPKIEELLMKNNISTFSELAATPVSQLKEILESAGSRFAVHDPGTWPAQSLLAATGEWENLKSYQGFLNAGKRPD